MDQISLITCQARLLKFIFKYLLILHIYKEYNYVYILDMIRYIYGTLIYIHSHTVVHITVI